jgi:DNA (cytosine-5)-methyltransferase 1
MSHVDLCSGIGGFALGFEWAGLSKPVLFCDIEPWSRKVLSKHWPDVPIAHDVKELANDPARLVPDCDILTAGYPCQPFSVAGKQRGKEDPRHIYPHISEIIAHKRPAFVVLENVFGHLSLGLDEVLNDLANKDYAARAFIFPSGAIVGAPHHRNRIFIIARNVGNSEHDGSSAATVSGKHREDEAGCAEGQSASEQSEGASEPRHDANVGNAAHNGRNSGAAQAKRERAAHQSDQSQSGLWGKSIGSGENVADTDSERGRLWHTEWQDAENVRRWNTEPRICHLVDGLPKGLDRFDGWEREPADIPRVATGVKDRVSRLKGLGNAIVPSIAMQIGLTIKAVRDA